MTIDEALRKVEAGQVGVAVVDHEAMADELADSMIPALVGLEALGLDGGKVVMDKSLADVKREAG